MSSKEIVNLIIILLIVLFLLIYTYVIYRKTYKELLFQWNRKKIKESYRKFKKWKINKYHVNEYEKEKKIK